jgi:3-oxoadipate enol-lactonase
MLGIAPARSWKRNNDGKIEGNPVTTVELKTKKRVLSYRIRGKGEPLLLIHGLGSSGADWEAQVRALERRFRVIIPDLPGTGSSSPMAVGFRISDVAETLWAFLDQLGIATVNIAGFSLGGAVGLEMALQRPADVPRLALINSLATYRINHWRKWLEARLPPILIRLFGVERTARITAARLFPENWQKPLRERCAEVMSRISAESYLGMARALERWSAIDRLSQLKARTLLIAAEHDFTPLVEKIAMAKLLGAQIAIVRGSRHATPFDSMAATNNCLLALFTDQPLSASHRWVRDGAPRGKRLARLRSLRRAACSIAKAGIRRLVAWHVRCARFCLLGVHAWPSTLMRWQMVTPEIMRARHPARQPGSSRGPRAWIHAFRKRSLACKVMRDDCWP